MEDKPYDKVGETYKFSKRKPLSCNHPETKYEVFFKGKKVADHMFWDKNENNFCIEDQYLARTRFVEWRLKP